MFKMFNDFVVWFIVACVNFKIIFLRCFIGKCVYPCLQTQCSLSSHVQRGLNIVWCYFVSFVLTNVKSHHEHQSHKLLTSIPTNSLWKRLHGKMDWVYKFYIGIIVFANLYLFFSNCILTIIWFCKKEKNMNSPSDKVFQSMWRIWLRYVKLINTKALP